MSSILPAVPAGLVLAGGWSVDPCSPSLIDIISYDDHTGIARHVKRRLSKPRHATSFPIFGPRPAPRSLTHELIRAHHRRHYQRQADAGRAAADRAGNDRGDRREPHRGARGGRGVARRGAGGDAPGRRRLRRRECAPPVPHRLRRAAHAREVLQRHGAAHGHRDRSGRACGRARQRRPKCARSRTAFEADRRCDCARRDRRSTRTSPSTAASPTPTGNPQFLRFLEYLGRFIIPRRTIRAAGDHRRCAPISNRSRSEHRDIVVGDPQARAWRARAPPCGGTCSTAASAISARRRARRHSDVARDELSIRIA